MSIRSTLRMSDESQLLEGTPAEVAEKKRRAHDAKLRPKRLEVARRNAKWTEIENDLVPRGRGWLVSAETDAIYRPARGEIFEPYSVDVVADMSELWFYADERDGELHFLERVKTPATWSEHVARQAAKKRSRAAPEPRIRRGK